jgi:hypothetical protein
MDLHYENSNLRLKYTCHWYSSPHKLYADKHIFRGIRTEYEGGKQSLSTDISTISLRYFSPSIRTSYCCQCIQVVVMQRTSHSQMSSGPTVGLETVMAITRVFLTDLLLCRFPWVLDPALDVRLRIYRWCSLQQRWDVLLTDLYWQWVTAYRRSNWLCITVAHHWTFDLGVRSSLLYDKKLQELQHFNFTYNCITGEALHDQKFNTYMNSQSNNINRVIIIIIIIITHIYSLFPQRE